MARDTKLEKRKFSETQKQIKNLRESRCHTTGPVESAVQGPGRGDGSNSKQQKRRRKSRGNPEKTKPEKQSRRWTLAQP